MLALLLPFALKFLGAGAIQSWMNAKVKLAESASEVDKTYLNAQVDAMKYELASRKAQREYALSMMAYRSIRYPMAMILWTVAIYVCSYVLYDGLKVSIFNITILEPSAFTQHIIEISLSFMFGTWGAMKVSRK